MFAPLHGPDKDIWSLSLYDDIAVINRFISGDSLQPVLIAGIVAAVLAPFIALANGIVLAAIWKDPYKQLRSSPSNIIIASMACSDFLVGIVCSSVQCYCYLVTYINGRLTTYAVFASYASGIFFVGISLAHVVVLTVDRVLAVSKPMLYKARVTKFRLIKTLVIIWVLYLLLASLHYFLRYYVYIYTTIILTISTMTVLISCVLSAMIAYLVRKQTHELKVEKNLNANWRRVTERDRKTTRTILIIILLLLLCCSPFSVVALISLTCTKCGISGAKVLMVAHNFTLVLLHVNSLVNPFLYAFRLPKFKKPIKLIVKFLINCKQLQMTPARNSLEMTVDSISTPKVDRNRKIDKSLDSENDVDTKL